MTIVMIVAPPKGGWRLAERRDGSVLRAAFARDRRRFSAGRPDGQIMMVTEVKRTNTKRVDEKTALVVDQNKSIGVRQTNRRHRGVLVTATDMKSKKANKL